MRTNLLFTFPDEIWTLHIGSNYKLGTALLLVRTCKYFWNRRHKLVCFAEVDFYKEILERKQYSKGLSIALENKDYDLLHVFLDRTTNWLHPLKASATIGDLFFVEFCLERVPEHYKKCGMFAAALAGQNEIVQWFLDKGYRSYKMAMSYAALGGHLDIVQMFADGVRNYERAVRWAASRGHIHVVEYLLNKREYFFAYSPTLEAAAAGGQLALVELLVQKARWPRGIDWAFASRTAMIHGHLHIVKYFEQKGGFKEDMQLFLLGKDHIEYFLWKHWRLSRNNLVPPITNRTFDEPPFPGTLFHDRESTLVNQEPCEYCYERWEGMRHWICRNMPFDDLSLSLDCHCLDTSEPPTVYMY